MAVVLKNTFLTLERLEIGSSRRSRSEETTRQITSEDSCQRILKLLQRELDSTELPRPRVERALKVGSCWESSNSLSTMAPESPGCSSEEETEQPRKRTAEPMTTIMIRNIPNRLSQWALSEELDTLGFAGAFDFLYVPLDLRSMSNVGYAFINFSDAAGAKRCAERLQGMRLRKMSRSGKVLEVSRARVQGKEANTRHFLKACNGNGRLRQRRPILCKDDAADGSLVLA